MAILTIPTRNSSSKTIRGCRVERDAGARDTPENGEAAVTTSQATDGRRWYVVRTKPKQEARADANLRAWGLETLALRIWEPPCSRTRRAHAGEMAPLFPGYLFVRFEAETLVTKVRLTRGVHSVVGLGESATPIDDAVVSLLRSRAQEDGLVRLAEPKCGDVVEIIDGPLRSLAGIFERDIKGQARVLILLTSLGYPLHVQLPRTSVRRQSARGGLLGPVSATTYEL